jgi:N-acetyl sugar amidotransferase
MDTTDPEIAFDDAGVCHHCRRYDAIIARDTKSGEAGRAALDQIADRIRRAGAGKRYDCVIGLSGGVDSSYVAYLAKHLGLRPLAVHLDNGWNSETAVRNIETIVNRLGIDLFTEVLDWEEFRSLQVAFLRASTPDCEIPTDHAIRATLFAAAAREGVRYIVNGVNVATELIMPRAWSHGHFDWRYVKAVADRHGDRPLRTFPRCTLFDMEIRYRWLQPVEQVFPLNYIEYDKSAAMETIASELGWQAYGGKHHESIYTRFYQTWLLPKKFGVDKRRAHLSCLVAGGRTTRQCALAHIAQPAIDAEQMEIDRRFVVKKLGLSEPEFDAIVRAPIRSFADYPSYEAIRDRLKTLVGRVWTRPRD